MHSGANNKFCIELVVLIKANETLTANKLKQGLRSSQESEV
jgi:hypothetical protein